MIALAWALLSTEAMKLRRTPPVWLALGAPLFAILLELFSVFHRNAAPSGEAAAQWNTLLQNGWGIWAGLCLPMLISFEAASLIQVEQAGKHWKQLFAYPIPRWSVYATKMLMCGLLGWISVLIAVPGFVGDVLIYSGFHGLGLASSIPWSGILSAAGRVCLASCLLVAVQTWISTRFSGIAMPLGIGLAALLVGFVLLPIRQGELAAWWPWTLPLSALPTSNPHGLQNRLLSVVLGCAGGVVAGAFLCWDLARRREAA